LRANDPALFRSMSFINRFPARLTLICLLAVGGVTWHAHLLPAQKRVTSEKEGRPELGDKPESVLRVETLKATLKQVDLEKRTITVTHKDGDSVFSFPTAAGREKVNLSKKAAKLLGKKSLRLEDVKVGSQVKVAYYPALGTVMEFTVEEMAK